MLRMLFSLSDVYNLYNSDAEAEVLYCTFFDESNMAAYGQGNPFSPPVHEPDGPPVLVGADLHADGRSGGGMCRV